MSLRDLYESGYDVRDSQIPLEWKESFSRFMFGSNCMIMFGDDGSPEFVYHSYDFKRWYDQNSVMIDRSTKIGLIID